MMIRLLSGREKLAISMKEKVPLIITHLEYHPKSLPQAQLYQSDKWQSISDHNVKRVIYIYHISLNLSF